ncbi:384_t:CDS:1, partial [Paraglomus occultum]
HPKSNGPRPSNPFFLFLSDMRLQPSKPFFHCPLQRLFTKRVGDCWRQMTDQEKLPWYQRAEELRRKQKHENFEGSYIESLCSKDSGSEYITTSGKAGTENSSHSGGSQFQFHYEFINYSPKQQSFKGGIVKNKNNRQNVAAKSTNRSAGGSLNRRGHFDIPVEKLSVNSAIDTTATVMLDTVPAPVLLAPFISNQLIIFPHSQYFPYAPPTLMPTLSTESHYQIYNSFFDTNQPITDICYEFIPNEM